MTWIGGGLGWTFAALLVGLAVAALSTVWDALPTAARSDAAWRELLLDPAIQQAALRSVAVVLLASGLAGAIATPLAFVAVHNRPVVRAVILALGLLPLAMPPFVLAAVLNEMTAHAVTRFTLAGPVTDDLRTFSLLVSAYALHGMPIVLLSLFIGLARLDRSQAESARSHGIPDLVAWYRISLPMLTPSFALALAWLTLRVLGDAGAPLALGRTDLLAPLLLEQTAASGGLSARGAQLAMLLIAFHAVVFALTWPFLLAPKDTIAPPRSTPGASVSATLIALLSVGVLSLSPLAWLVKRADWAQVVASPVDLAAGVAPVLSIPAATAVVLLLLGLPAAILTRLPGVTGRLVRLTTALLLAVPGLVFAIGLAPLGGSLRFGGVEAWPTLAAALALALPLLPFVPHLAGHITLRPDREATDLARGIGATPGRLTLRLLFPGLALLSAALASVGAVLGLMETSTVLASSVGGHWAPATDLLGSIAAGPTDRHWAPAATLSTGISVMLCAGVALFLRLGSTARRPTPWRRPA